MCLLSTQGWTVQRCLRRLQTWNSRTLEAALATQGLHLKPRTVRKYLRLMGASDKRAKLSLKQNWCPRPHDSDSLGAAGVQESPRRHPLDLFVERRLVRFRGADVAWQSPAGITDPGEPQPAPGNARPQLHVYPRTDSKY